MKKVLDTDCLKEFEKEFYNKKISKDEYFSKLDDVNCYQTHLMKALVYYHDKDLCNAKKEIDTSVRMIESSEDGDWERFISMHYPIRSKVFQTAGQIYADLDRLDESREYYIKSQYFSIQLKSDFENIESGIVYSFRNVSVYSLSDLISNSITVCHPSKMNDPFDSLFLLWSSEDNLNKTCNNKTHIKPFSDSFQYFKIRCFVGNKKLSLDNNLIRKVVMWSHYADAHQGFCIRYRLSKAFIKQDEGIGYSHKYLKKVHYLHKNEAVSILPKRMDTNNLFVWKSAEWKYENEIRLISYEPRCKSDHLQIRLDAESTIEAIYFGYRCIRSNISNIMQILGDGVQYFKMECDPNNVYKMKVNKILFKDYINV
nr:MAG TPA: Putative abortive phage resistance protein AbiGi, antitoxin [Caudoviricetes sp.]